MPKFGKQRNNLCNNVRRGTNPVHQPSRELHATEFIRKTLVDKDTDLELLWSMTTGKRHDCVFESEWSEDSVAARSSGWWWKKHFVNEDKHHTTNERIWLKARFAIRGRLMFANHKPDAPFHFSQLTQHSPGHHTARVTGKVNYRAKDPDKVARKGQQIWVYYGEEVSFG
ncbi:hypothetical protein QFC20_002720 [Naganishia adeliensis]|uniref:Uncharacterized protein n=1 Tax=Naganishia adeliensis TaxID=92952 RepID=A0ACC2WIE3_9TREE|nr:hypothetical protein QFC20_002720 [Naganishia adeliensis]